ncbi:hypothetical protein D3C71_2103170 [compost metagenome]
MNTMPPAAIPLDQMLPILLSKGCRIYHCRAVVPATANGSRQTVQLPLCLYRWHSSMKPAPVKAAIGGASMIR